MIGTNGSNRSKQITVGWFLLFASFFLYPFYQHLFSTEKLLLIFIASCYGIAIVTLANLSRLTATWNPSVAFLILVPLAFFGAIKTDSLGSELMVFVVTIPIAVVLSFQTNWVESCTAAAVALLSVHSLATIIFFQFPELHQSVRAATRLSTFPASWDYRAALTGHYSYNGMYTALALILAGTILFTTPRRSMRVLAFLVSSLSAFALILTTKRAAFVFAVVTLVVVLFSLKESTHNTNRQRRVRRFYITIAGVGSLIVAATTPIVSQLLDRFFTDSSSASEFTSGRTLLWSHAVELWQSAPVFGIGWGGYRLEWIDGGTLVTSIGAHNVVLQLLAETGVVGAVLFVTLYLTSLVSCSRKLKTVRTLQVGESGRIHGILAGSLGIQVFFGLYSLVGNPLYDSPIFIMYFLAVAGTISLQPNRVDSAPDLSQRGVNSGW